MHCMLRKLIGLIVAVVAVRFSWDVLGSAFENWYHTVLKPLAKPWLMGNVYMPVSGWCSRFLASSVTVRFDMVERLLSPVWSLAEFLLTAVIALTAMVLLSAVAWFVWIQGGVRPALKTVENGFRAFGKNVCASVRSDVAATVSWFRKMYGSAQKDKVFR
jgi:hypothetical protein